MTATTAKAIIGPNMAKRLSWPYLNRVLADPPFDAISTAPEDEMFLGPVARSYFFLRATFLPLRRASDRPMAIACFRL
jgi:hypothetical protein